MFRLLSILSLLEKEKIPKKYIKNYIPEKFGCQKLRNYLRKFIKKSDLFSIKSLREKCLNKIIIKLIKILITSLIKL